MDEPKQKMSKKRLHDLFPWLLKDVTELAPADDPYAKFWCTRLPQKFLISKSECWARGANPGLFEDCIGCPISVKRIPKSRREAMADKPKFAFCTACGLWYSRKEYVTLKKGRGRCACGWVHTTLNQGDARQWWELQVLEKKMSLQENGTVVATFRSNGTLESVVFEPDPPKFVRKPRPRKQAK